MSKNFWLNIQQSWNDTHKLNIILNVKDIIFGYNIHHGAPSDLSTALNIIILYGKSVIIKCRLKNLIPNKMVLKNCIKDALQMCNYEEEIASLIQRAFLVL